VPLEKTTRNALKVLTLLGREDVPVGMGAAAPLERPLATAEDIHGKTGLDGPELPEPGFEPDGRGAVGLMADAIEGASEPVTLVPVGPLTNVAMLLRERPDLAIGGKIREIVLMGGSMGLGNTTPAAEFNIYVDPEAARIVFGSGLPVTMVGLDVTHLAGAGPEQAEKMRSLGRAGGAAADLVGFFASTYKRVFGFDAPAIHDAVAVASVAAPAVLTTRRMRVDVECEGEFTRGETVCDLHGVTGREPNASVGVGLDRERFFGLLYRALAAFP